MAAPACNFGGITTTASSSSTTSSTTTTSSATSSAASSAVSSSSAATSACFARDFERVDVTVADRVGVTPLMMAAVAGNDTVVQRLLELGADPDARTAETGDTALLRACFFGTHARTYAHARGMASCCWFVLLVVLVVCK